MNAQIPPGWYDDPDGSRNADRRWDGHNWTPERRRKTTRTPPPAYPQPPQAQAWYPQPAPPPSYPPPGQAQAGYRWLGAPARISSGARGQTTVSSRRPWGSKGVIVILLVVVAAIVVSFAIAALGTHGFRDDYAYRIGYDYGSNDVAYGLLNTNVNGSDAACAALFGTAVITQNVNRSSKGDFVDGCVAGYRDQGGIH